MNRSILVVWMLVIGAYSLLPQQSAAGFPIGPNHTINNPSYTTLTSRLLHIKKLGDYVLGVVPDGFVIFRLEPETWTLTPLTKVYTDFATLDIRVTNTQIIFRSEDHKLHFYDAGQLPAVEFQGTLDPGVPFADYLITGRYLYLSRWFDGISVYRIENFSSLTFADSSLKGVLVTQLARTDEYLYALDEYNGILRYHNQFSRVGPFRDALLIPERSHSFQLIDSQVVVLARPDHMFIGHFAQVDWDSSRYSADLQVAHSNRRMFLVDDGILLVSERAVSLMERFPPYRTRKQIVIDELLLTGDVFLVNNEPYLILPGQFGGAMVVPILRNIAPFFILNRPGLIGGVQLNDRKIYSGGITTPVEVYDLLPDSAPTYTYSFPSSSSGVRSTDNIGDTVVALYSPANRYDIVYNAGTPESLVVESRSYSEQSQASGIRLVSGIHDSLTAVIVQESKQLSVMLLPTASGTVLPHAVWESAFDITSYLVLDSVLLVGSAKKSLMIYTFNERLNASYRTQRSLAAPAQAIVALDSVHALVFADRVIRKLDISTPSAPIVESTIVVDIRMDDVEIENGVLFGVGPNGIGVFSLKSDMPVFLDRGGRWGRHISVDDTTVATTDGSAIHVYELRNYADDSLPVPPAPSPPTSFVLATNYPNPFNASTRIRFSLAVEAPVTLTIHNILGQRVRTLVDRIEQAGIHEVRWDGQTDGGTPVASGVYFYRLESSGRSETRSLVLTK